MENRESANSSGRSGTGVATFVFVGTKGESLSSLGGEAILSEPHAQASIFPLPSDAVREAVGVVAEAPDTRYAAIATGEVDLNDLGEALDRLKAIAAVGQRGQVVVSLVTRELARASLPSDYEFHSLGAVHLSTGQIEQLMLVVHPSLQPTPASIKVAPPTRRQTPFIGRLRDLEEVRRLLDLSRVVSVVGPSGIGKSSLIQRLLTEVDSEFSDGVARIDLSTVARAALVEPTLIRLVEAPKLPGEEHLDALIAYLRPRRFLLVFDNAEHLLPEVRRIVITLIDACPELAVLIGSQRPLRTAGEARYLLDGLDLPSPVEHWKAMQHYDSVALFVDRAQLVDTRFRLNASNAADIAALCQRLDGIPLAIELAASKTKALSPKQILGRLDDRFLLLKDSDDPSRPDRQRTLKTTVDWGYEHLREEGRVLLRRLSVFSGAFTVDQAIEVCADDVLPSHMVLAAFEELVDGSMLAASSVAGTEKRFYLTETIRLYARDRLRKTSEGSLFQARHRDWCMRFADEAESKLMGREQIECLNRLDASYEDIRNTIEWHLTRSGDPKIAVRMLLAIHPYFFLRHYIAEGLRLTRQVIDAQTTRDVPQIGRALNLASVLASRIADEETARAYAVRSVTAARKMRDISGIARARNSLAFMAQNSGRLAKARRHFLGAVDAFRTLNDHGRLLRLLVNVSVLDASLGFLEDAKTHLREAGTLLGNDPDPTVRAYYHQNWAHVALAERQPIEAIKHSRTALDLLDAVREAHGVATCMRNFAYAYDMLGQSMTAAFFVGMAQEKARELEQHLYDYEAEALRGLTNRLKNDLGSDLFEKVQTQGTQASIADAVVTLEETLAFNNR